MGARAIWKGTLTFEDIEVPVKLYSAVEDRNVRFRLLHRKDSQPVRQALLNPDSGETVSFKDTQRVYHSDEGARVMIDRDELEAIQPEKSRDIKVLHFLPYDAIDHRWYDRPYYLGPDDSHEAYTALTVALQDSQREGLAHWVMRNKEYYGALRLYQGYPMLMSLRYEAQVVSTEELTAPEGKPLDKKELSMARQLIGMLESSFEPEEYQDDYREKVLELIERKQKGGSVKAPAIKRKKPSADVAKALEASLKGMKKEGKNGGKKKQAQKKERK